MAKRKKKADIDGAVVDAKELWARSRELAGGTPDGEYECQLQDIELVKDSNGNPMVKRQHLILSGEFAGETIFDNCGLSHEVGQKIFIAFLRNMGVDEPEDFDDLPDALMELKTAAPTYRAKVKTSDNGFTNVTCYEAEDIEPADEDAFDADEEEEAEEGAEAEEPEEEEEEDDKTLTALRDFAIAQGFEDEDVAEADQDELVEALGEEEYKEEDLTADEIALLKEVGIKVKAKAKAKKKAKKKATRKK